MKPHFALGLLLTAAIGCQLSPQNRAARPSQAVAPATAQAGSAPPTAATSETDAGAETKAKAAPSTIVLTAAQTPVGTDAPVTSEAAQAGRGPETIDTPPGDIGMQMSLADALATGLMQNPDLITVRGTANVNSAMVDVARVYPWNPFVQAQFLPQGHPFVPATTPGSQAGGANYYIWLMQRFELGHQRRYREEGAIAAFGQARWNIRLAELNNIAQTERLFFAALYQRQLHDLAGDTETLSARLIEVIERRFHAGIATPIEMANARVAARQSHRQNQLAEANYQAALLALKQQLGMSPSCPLILSGNLSDYEWQAVGDVFCSVSQAVTIDPERLAMEMAEARPDVMVARSGAAIARANLNLARAARIPDVQGGPIYSTADNGTGYIGFRVQRDIAIWNNGSALAGQRETELQQQVRAHAQLTRRATNEASAAIDRYERARRFVADGGPGQGDSSGSELDQVIGQFEAGKADIVNVLGIQNNLLADLRSQLDLLNEVAQAAAQVTQATGLPPERLLAPPKPEPLPPTAGDPPQPPKIQSPRTQSPDAHPPEAPTP